MTQHTVIGVDLAKTSFSLVALAPQGQERWRKTVKRGQVLKLLAKQAPCAVALEACAGAHYWGRQIEQLGHRVVMLPPQHVKAYLRGQKNDYNDARAIAEACQHGHVRSVRIKTVVHQDAQLLNDVRRQLNQERVRLGNQIRALLVEYGVALPKGVSALRRRVPEVLENAEHGLTALSRELLLRQYRRWCDLCQELSWYDSQLVRQAREDEVCRRLSELPGFGPMVSSVVKGWMGDGRQFRCGREASAALGVVPRQHSTGGREVLLGITKKGDRYVRATVVHGARSVVQHAKGKEDRLSRWINRLVAERGHNKAVVALANKLVRIAWVIVARGEQYQATLAH